MKPKGNENRHSKRSAPDAPARDPLPTPTGRRTEDVIGSGDGGHGKRRYREKPRHWTEYGQAFAAIVGVPILFVYTVFTGQQTAFLVNSQRPWVGYESGAVVMKDVGQPIERNVQWKNYGASPALGMCWRTYVTGEYRVGFQWHVVQRDMDALTCSEGVGESGTLTLPPGQDVEVQRGRTGAVLLAGQKEAVQRGDMYLILYGKAIYRDQRGDSHSTTFCRRLEAAQGTLPDRMFPCPEVHESAD